MIYSFNVFVEFCLFIIIDLLLIIIKGFKLSINVRFFFFLVRKFYDFLVWMM